MAERIIRQLIDDLDGTEIAEGQGERVEFAFRGATYQIDLTDTNVAKLEKALAPYIKSATKVGGNSKPRSRAPKGGRSSRGKVTREKLATVRSWAKKNGYQVSARGRIPADVIEAYHAVHAR
ncbi:Lsr2 family protein [uncultured Mycobacterium sp.]|uniref:histone-like nucleoid-structuring protein Lsr2 n=1 Tax=uncultured Mycobacterium sp. TaxID=171292 RepID=UPI0035CB79F1